MAKQRAKGTPVTDEEREQIIAALRSGKSQYAVAKEFRRGRNTVSVIAKRAGIDSDNNATAAAARARSQYAAEQRIELVNKAFEKLEAILDNFSTEPDQARNMRDLATSLGILIDKRRLEDGDVTERAEMVTIIDDIPKE